MKIKQFLWYEPAHPDQAQIPKNLSFFPPQHVEELTVVLQQLTFNYFSEGTPGSILTLGIPPSPAIPKPSAAFPKPPLPQPSTWND